MTLPSGSNLKNRSAIYYARLNVPVKRASSALNRRTEMDPLVEVCPRTNWDKRRERYLRHDLIARVSSGTISNRSPTSP